MKSQGSWYWNWLFTFQGMSSTRGPSVLTKSFGFFPKSRNCRPLLCCRVTPDRLSCTRPLAFRYVTEPVNDHLFVIRFTSVSVAAWTSLFTPSGFVIRNARSAGSLTSLKTLNVCPDGSWPTLSVKGTWMYVPWVSSHPAYWRPRLYV